MAVFHIDGTSYEVSPRDNGSRSAFRGTGESRGDLLPVYFVADVSSSMTPVVGILNEGLASLLEALESQPMAASKVRFSVIGFNGQASTVLPMSDLREIEAIDQLTASGWTSYAAAFRLLKSRIDSDVRSLKKQGYSVHRPAVFFLSDGDPKDDRSEWEAALSELTDPSFSAHPNILAFGIGKADERVIARVATKEGFAFRHAGGSNLGKAVAEFMEALTHSVIASGSAVAQGKPMAIEKPAGFLTIETDVI